MRLLMSIALSLFAVSSIAQDRVMTPEDLMKIKSVKAAKISPDGTYVAYTLTVPRTLFTEDNGKAWSELWVWDEANGSRPFITGKVSIGNFAWTPDSKGISFVSKRGDDKKSSLYIIPVNGGEARKVLSHEEGIGQYEWSQDGNKLVFIAPEAKDKSVKELADKGFDQEIYEETIPRDLVWIADFSKGDEPEVSQVKIEGHVNAVTWNPDGERLAIAKSPTSLVDETIMLNRAFVISAATGETLMAVNNPGKLGMMAWSPNGRHLAMISAADPNDPSEGRLFIADTKKKNVDKFFLKDEGDVSSISWKDEKTIAYLWNEGVDISLRTLTIGSKKGKDAYDASSVVVSGLGIANTGKRIAMVGSSPNNPAEVYLWEDGAETARRLTDSNPWLKEVKLGKQEAVNYKARDGLDLQGILIRPVNEEKGKRYPLIIMVHGGPEAHISNSWVTNYSRYGQVAAAHGFATFYPNYRASTGRGVAFSKLDHGRPAKEEFDDIVDAITHLADNMGLVDKKKVGITGGSYGGYATAWGATALSEHFAAGVMFVGISNKISKFGTSDIPEELFMVHDRMRVWGNWEKFLEASPIYHVEKARTPLLIMHGDSDTRVHPSQSMELYRHLKTLGKVPVRLVFYKGEGHGNRKAASQYDYLLRSLRWFNHYLKGDGGEMPPYQVEYPAKPADSK